MKATQSKKPVVGPVTAQYDFCPMDGDGQKLLSVRAGIPLNRALDQLSMMMGSTIDAVEVLAEEKDVDRIPGSLWQAVHFMKITHALVESMNRGCIEYVNNAEPSKTPPPNSNGR